MVLHLASTAAMFVTATATAAYGSQRSRRTRPSRPPSNDSREGHPGHPEEDEEESHQATIGMSDAIRFPIISSISLLVMFFCFKYLATFLVLYVVVAGFLAVKFCLQEPLRSALGGAAAGGADSIATWCGVASVLAWVCTGSWLLNNVLGVALAVTFIASVRLPSLRVAVLCLGCLFVYDFFWVFLSSRIFGANVMVTVATTAAASPVSRVSKALRIPFLSHAIEELQLPFKLIFPADLGFGGEEGYAILGLGDIALPGLCLALALAFDDHLAARQSRDTLDSVDVAENGLLLEGSSSSKEKEGRLAIGGSGDGYSTTCAYFRGSLWGYSLGLVASFGFSHMFDAAQPALIYLVPGVILPLVARAVKNSHLRPLWAGFEVPAPAAGGSIVSDDESKRR